MTFGERLRRFRKENGMTQEHLANCIGVAKTTITGYEKNSREPNVIRIAKLAEALGVTGNDLLGIEKPKTADNRIEKQSLRLLSSFNKLNDIGQKEATKRVEELTHIEKYTNKEIDHSIPIAAHYDGEMDEEEERKIQQDLEEL